MKPTEMYTGQKVTIFRHHPNKYFYINDKVGQIGTIVDVSWYGNNGWYAKVQLKDGFVEWFTPEMLELTPTPDQAKIGARIQIADATFSTNVEYAGAFGTIVSSLYGYDNNVDVLPDDPALRDEWGTITLSGLNRFRILEQSPERLTKTFDKGSVYIEVWPRDSDGISHKLEFKWCDCMKSSTLRDQINIFIDKMEKM